MILEQLLSYAALATASICALLRGAVPERIGAALIAAGWILTPLAEHRRSWFDPQLAMFLIDAAVLVGLGGLSFATGRLWAVCAAAVQLIALAQYPLFWAWPHQLYRAFYYANFALGYLILGALIGGCIVEATDTLAVEEIKLDR